MPGPVALATVLSLLVASVSLCTSQTDGLTCKPQGALVLDQPYPALQKPNPPLPTCKQFECSCCNASHAGSLQRSLSTAAEDSTFSRRCLSMLAMINCYVCDPEVGIGLKTGLCASTCDDWYAACKNDFFGFQGQRQGLQPCTEADIDRLSVCGKLKELATDGSSLCEAAGFKVVSSPADGLCYDGEQSAAASELCAAAPTSQRLRSAASDGSETERRSAGSAQLLELVQQLRNLTLTAAVAMLLLKLLKAFQRSRDVQVAVRRADPAVLADAAARRMQ